MLTAVAITFAINVLTSLLKNLIVPRFGVVGVHITAFILALVGAWYFIYGQNIPSIQEWVAMALGLFSLAVAFYEVILQRIPLFKDLPKAIAGERG